MSAYEVERRLLITAMLVIISIAAFVACGCSTTEVAEAEVDERFVEEYETNHLIVITDRKTGCQYLYYKDYKQGGFTQLTDQYGYPLLADGYERGSVTVLSQDYGE